MDQMDSTGCNKPWKLLWKWTAIPGCLSDNINVYLRWHITGYTRVWERESVKTATCWLLVSATALSMSSLANSPYLPYHVQSMRRKPKLSSSSLVHFHDSFHILFSFKQLKDRIKTLMSGFKHTTTKKVLFADAKQPLLFCFFPQHEAHQWDTLRLPFRHTAQTSIAEQCRHPSTACPKVLIRFLHSGSSLPEITALSFWADSDFQGNPRGVRYCSAWAKVTNVFYLFL